MRGSPPIELYVDGGSRGNPGPAACAYVIKYEDGKILDSQGVFLGKATNNVAEYMGLLHGLDAVRKLDVKELNIFSDSELMVKQLIGEYRVKSKELSELFEQAQRHLLSFDRWQIKHIKREFNARADRIVNQILDDNERGKLKSPEPEIAGQAVEKILVEVVTSADQDHCPAKMQKGQCFVFSEFAASGICIHAANSVLKTIVEMRHDDHAKIIKCNKSGCGAEFKLSIIK